MDLLYSNKPFFVFLLNSLKSSWTQVRVYSYDILLRYPDNYPLFNDPEFVNKVIYETALELSCNPKAMISEASALFFNLLFNKCLPHLMFIDATQSKETQ